MKTKRSLLSAIPSAIIFGIIVGMITYFGLNFAGYNEYQADAKVVTSSVENGGDNEQSASTYAATIDSPKIKQRTLENLGLDWNVSDLDSKLQIIPIENSSIIDISVYDTNKLRAEDIADEYADLTVRVINNIYNSGAEVMEYSYGSATVVDNTLKYAIILGVIGFLSWAILNMIYISSSNKKITGAISKPVKKVEEVKEVREVKEKPNKKEKIKKEIIEEEIVREDIAKEDTKENIISDVDDDSDFSKTQVINKDEISEMIDTNNYEVLGRIPPYEKGDLDV